MSRRAGLKQTLHTVFGIQQLHPGQDEVIRSILAGRNTLAIMPTGAGKSLCYQLPALQLEGTTVIVSPLISLMKDQVDKLEEKGIDVAQVNSALTGREQQHAIEKIEEAASEFVFTTPERFTDAGFIDTLRRQRIDFLVIDEAHCISQWGHDFRPAFLGLRDAIKALGSPPVLALTATATPEVIADIKQQLDLTDWEVINTGIYRPNLRYEVIQVTHEEEKNGQLLRLIEEIAGTGIVYAATIKSVTAITEYLKSAGVEVAEYHGQLNVRQRKAHQEQFMADRLKAIVATNAFGMGIDKPDIRFVIHYQIPGTLEAYYQESGRAGRDGQLARCILLYDLNDRRTQQFFLSGRYPRGTDLSAVYQALKQLQTEATLPTLAQVQEMAGGVATTKLRVIISLLKQQEWLKEQRGPRFQLLQDDVQFEELERLAQQYEQKSENDRQKLEQMMRYAQSALCRWQLLLNYFGEDSALERCDNCDNCLHPWEERIELPAELRERLSGRMR